MADVHLGKSAVFRNQGLPMPGGELQEDLSRITALLLSTRAARLVVLGDLVHGPVSAQTRAVVAEWRAEVKVEWCLIRGNHDRHAPELPLEWRVTEWDSKCPLGPFLLVHEPVRHAGHVVLAGHVHPMVRLGQAASALRFPAFIYEDDLLLLPAFTVFSGGPSMGAHPRRWRYACTGEQTIALDEG